MKTYQALADALVDEGIDTVFGLLGGGNDGLIWELQQRGCRFIASRHEQGAVGMADGYSRATGRIGLASVSHGPGLTNAATPLVAARCSKSRLLVITSDTGATNRLSNMYFEQAPFIRSTAGALQELASPAMLSEAVELCLRHVRAGWGPIVLNTPDPVIGAEMPEGLGWAPTGLGSVVHQRLRPDPDVLERIAPLLLASKRPLLIAGRGAVWSEARDVLVELAARIGAIVGTTLLAKSFFAGDPYDIGVTGGFAVPGAAVLIREADVVLSVGASLSQETTSRGVMFRNATVIQIDTDPAMASDQFVADHVVVGDARTTAEDLLALLAAPGNAAAATVDDSLPDGASAGAPQPATWRDEEMVSRIAAIDRFEGIDFAEEPGFVNPYAAYRLADELLPAERLLLVDGGYFMGGPAVHISVQDPRDQVLPWRFAAIGGSIGPAIGAAVGRPDRTVVLFTGDGGFMMNVQEIDTAVRYSLPLIIFVVNNGGFAMERPRYAAQGFATEMADYDNPDFAAVASALGFDGYRPSSSAELETILHKIGTPSRPTLIDLPVSKNASYLEIDRWVASYQEGYGG